MMVVMSEDWLRAAMTDDMLVVELLLRLKMAPPSRPSAVIPLSWGIRLPRSRATASASASASLSASSTRCDVLSSSKRKDGDSSSARCSPTTPLSWSGGAGAASPSATVDVFEETSRQAVRYSSAARSKGTATTETASNTAKRSRRKKTFAELKEEENFLLKERMHLKKELANLRATCKEQSVRNENLKRMKYDLNQRSTKKSSFTYSEPEHAICCQPNLKETSFNHVPSTLLTPVKVEIRPQSDSCESENTILNHDRFFFLPDLNMMPLEEEHGVGTKCGVR